VASTTVAAYWCDRARALGAGTTATARARGEFGAAHVAESLGDVEEARARFERAAELWRQAGEAGWLIIALTHLAGAYGELGDSVRSRSLNAEAFTLAQESGDVRAAAIVRSNMAMAFLEAGEDERAAV